VAALTAFLAAEKVPSAPIGWMTDGRNLRFATALDIEGVTEAGMVLFGRASLTLRDQNVTLGLSWDDPAAPGGNFDRLDWRPVDAHTNRGLGPPEHRFTLFEGSHHHPLAENGALAMGLRRAIRENLPVALPMEPEPPDWPAFVALAAQRWNLHDLVHLPLPPWQYDLPLPTGAGPSPRKGRRT
jgi:hypothetical protein